MFKFRVYLFCSSYFNKWIASNLFRKTQVFCFNPVFVIGKFVLYSSSRVVIQRVKEMTIVVACFYMFKKGENMCLSGDKILFEFWRKKNSLKIKKRNNNNNNMFKKRVVYYRYCCVFLLCQLQLHLPSYGFYFVALHYYTNESMHLG